MNAAHAVHAAKETVAEKVFGENCTCLFERRIHWLLQVTKELVAEEESARKEKEKPRRTTAIFEAV